MGRLLDFSDKFFTMKFFKVLGLRFNSIHQSDKSVASLFRSLSKQGGDQAPTEFGNEDVIWD